MSIKTEEEIRNFIDNVILIRKKSGLSKADMARILNIKLDSVDKIEAGELSDDVSVEVIFRIYNYFGISPRILFGKSLAEEYL